MEPYKELARTLESISNRQAAKAVTGIPCELGAITATGLKVDGFKHEIRDYLVADWEIKMELPGPSRVVKTAAPVNQDGTDIPGTTIYSGLSRLDFSVAEAGGPQATTRIHLNLKDGLKPGDRVLVVPVNKGQEMIVICKVVS